MTRQTIFTAAAGPEPPIAGLPDSPVERREGAWRVLPLEGAFEIAYEDGRGLRSVRRLLARELKLGPGKTLLGGVDRDRDGYRGFRADRIRRLTDPSTGERIERDVVDWLIRRAERHVRALTSARKSAARNALHTRGAATAPL